MTTQTTERGNQTTTDRLSDRELVVTRRVNGPAHLVYQAWTTPDLLKRWWAPKSFGITLVECQVDARTGGSYRFAFAHPAAEHLIPFFGKYLEVVPGARMVWTNEEEADGAVSTVTFVEADGVTLVTIHELYATKEALDEAVASGSTSGWPEQFDHLDLLLAA